MSGNKALKQKTPEKSGVFCSYTKKWSLIRISAYGYSRCRRRSDLPLHNRCIFQTWGTSFLGGQLKTGQLGSLQNRPTVWPRT
jgi:hypothetical protein